MRPFNLGEYLKDPSRKVVTREGRDVRIICTDMKGDYHIVALIKDGEEEQCIAYTIDGKLLWDSDENEDLFFVDEIPDFKPYDRVLTRGNNRLPWKANLFSNFKKERDTIIAVCLRGEYLLNDIIPFDENKVGKIE